MDAILEFRTAIAATGLTPPDHIIPGEVVCFAGLNKEPSIRSAWCRLFEDGLASLISGVANAH
jgi:hypothetical protein